jgi:predicted ferric reductase
MRKIRLVNKERFETFISVLGLIVMVVAFIAIPRQKSPIEKWHDAIDQGMTWNEYIGGEKSE